MNNYICTFNYQNEVTILETEAENKENAFIKWSNGKGVNGR